jgi:hypothetical protein
MARTDQPVQTAYQFILLSFNIGAEIAAGMTGLRSLMPGGLL